LKSLKICRAYRYKGKTFKEFPYDLKVLENARPVYEELPGWQDSLSHLRSFKQLPRQAKDYLRRIRDILQVKISLISVGSSREETIKVLD
ncbi:MAG: adenylosuccinate synthase, partial [Candidatus Omnitrophica bacterium]|nr:adenylosuccinate synthase [Candidatus Omnitrophota bacterium]